MDSAVNDPIKHVIVLMFENRSFDHMLGNLPGVNGVDPAHPRSNRESLDPQARRYSQQSVAARLDLDPKHEVENVAQQLNTDGACGGFVIDFAHAFPSSTPNERQEIMNYFPQGTLPALHALGNAFTICDQWYSSVPGPTWANRFFLHSGTSLGRVIMPSGIFHSNWHFYDQTTLYDRLNDAGIAWRIYYGDVPQSLVLVHQMAPRNAQHYHMMSAFFADCAGNADDFPAFAFIEPAYFGGAQNDQHPATDVKAGDSLLGQVYNAIRRNQALWESTLFICLHDEHGGFYDHVSPGPATPPDDHTEEYTFDRFGVRVPAILVSPWIARGVEHQAFDHTSLLKYLTDKWGLGPLGARTAAAASFAKVIGAVLRTDTPASVPFVAARALAAPAPATELNTLQQSLLGFTQLLDVKTVEPPEHKVARMSQMLEGPASQADVARQRVENFLAQQRGAAGAPKARTAVSKPARTNARKSRRATAAKRPAAGKRPVGKAGSRKRRS
jgi:phospholipase C